MHYTYKIQYQSGTKYVLLKPPNSIASIKFQSSTLSAYRLLTNLALLPSSFLSNKTLQQSHAIGSFLLSHREMSKSSWMEGCMWEELPSSKLEKWEMVWFILMDSKSLIFKHYLPLLIIPNTFTNFISYIIVLHYLVFIFHFFFSSL